MAASAPDAILTIAPPISNSIAPLLDFFLDARRFTLFRYSLRRHILDRWRKHRNVLDDRHSFERLASKPTPGEQLLRGQSMTPSHGADRHSRLISLGDDLRLALVAPLPPPAAARENLKPTRRLFIVRRKHKL